MRSFRRRVYGPLCLAVSAACGATESPLAEAAAIAIELLHCASLVHDDLPCFDDAALRRGRPALHRVYGEPLAVLTGDALLVLSFESVARVAGLAGERLAPLLLTLTQAAGAPAGWWQGKPGRASPASPWCAITAPRRAACSTPRSWLGCSRRGTIRGRGGGGLGDRRSLSGGRRSAGRDGAGSGGQSRRARICAWVAPTPCTS